jgi:hypothetical protein
MLLYQAFSQVMIPGFTFHHHWAPFFDTSEILRALDDNPTFDAEDITILLASGANDPTPVYLGVTLDRTLSFRAHLKKTAAKIKTRNNLISKLAGTKWSAKATTL